MSQAKENWVFFSALPPYRGGISMFSARTYKALSTLTHVRAFTFKQQYPSFLFPGSSQLDADYKGPLVERCGSTFNPFSYLSSALRFRREKPAVFVTSYWMTFMAPMMICWTLFLPKKTKKIAIIHNLVPHEKRFFDRVFNRWFLKSYDAFAVLSQSVKQDIIAFKPNARVAVLGHPPYEAQQDPMSTHEARTQLELDPGKKTLLFFGLIRPYKGLSELIEAFALLADDYQLIIAGEVYGSATIYEEALQRLPFSNWKFINSYIAEAEVATYFAAADLVVLPYQTATQSGIRAMALSHQRAVLCTKVGGLAEDLEANHHGFELHDTAAKPFADRIQLLFNQGDIEKCNRQLASLEMQLDNAWLQFAKGLIDLVAEP